MNIINKAPFGIGTLLILISLSIASPTSALSCLPVADYVKSVVGDQSTLIITATVEDTIDTNTYTAEVVTVTEAHQGYVDERMFLYHQKDETWGYLCNTGPAEKTGMSGVYIVTRDEHGMHQVAQRLATTDPVAVSLLESLEKTEPEGGISEITTTDRRNQIMTTIQELLTTITRLLKEYQYWK